VRSLLASSCRGSHPRSIVPFQEGLPGIGLGSTSPVSWRLFSQRLMVGIDTEKVFATSSLSTPLSTVQTTVPGTERALRPDTPVSHSALPNKSLLNNTSIHQRVRVVTSLHSEHPQEVV